MLCLIAGVIPVYFIMFKIIYCKTVPKILVSGKNAIIKPQINISSKNKGLSDSNEFTVMVSSNNNNVAIKMLLVFILYKVLLSGNKIIKRLKRLGF